MNHDPLAVLNQRCRLLIDQPDSSPLTPEDLIGFFQRFRPDGHALVGLYAGMPDGEELQRRLAQLYQTAGVSRREMGTDAYFIVRDPCRISAEGAEFHANGWIKSIQRMADAVSVSVFTSLPRARVLEGIAPKQPRSDQEHFPVLKSLKQNLPRVTQSIQRNHPVVQLMDQAYYYVACDPMLRDYLLWPAYQQRFDGDDLMSDYFALWKAGIKWRVFHNDTIDFYIPR